MEKETLITEIMQRIDPTLDESAKKQVEKDLKKLSLPCLEILKENNLILI
jgi:hypothetical protein